MVALGAAGVAGVIFFFAFPASDDNAAAGDGGILGGLIGKGLGGLGAVVGGTLNDVRNIGDDLLHGDFKKVRDDVKHSWAGKAANTVDHLARKNKVTGFASYEVRKSARLASEAIDDFGDGKIGKGIGKMISASPMGTLYRGIWDLVTDQKSKDDAAAMRKKWEEYRAQQRERINADTSLSPEQRASELRFVRFADQAASQVLHEKGVLWTTQHQQEALQLAHDAVPALEKKYEEEASAALVAKAAMEHKLAAAIESKRQAEFEAAQALQRKEEAARQQAAAIRKQQEDAAIAAAEAARKRFYSVSRSAAMAVAAKRVGLWKFQMLPPALQEKEVQTELDRLWKSRK